MAAVSIKRPIEDIIIAALSQESLGCSVYRCFDATKERGDLQVYVMVGTITNLNNFARGKSKDYDVEVQIIADGNINLDLDGAVFDILFGKIFGYAEALQESDFSSLTTCKVGLITMDKIEPLETNGDYRTQIIPLIFKVTTEI